MSNEDTDKDEESLFKFPCEFPIKAMGRSCPEFENAVMEIMNRLVPDLGEGAVTLKQSREGKYTAMTVVIMARDREQLDAIYMELTASEYVEVAL